MNSKDVILGMLRREPLSGYDIKRNFESLFSYFFDASYGTIYPTLKKMEQDGYITKEAIPQEGKPDKNLYHITEKGKQRFLLYLESPLEKDVIRSDFLMRLFFGQYVERDTIVAWLMKSKEYNEETLQRLEEDYDAFKDKMSPTQKICIQVGLKQHRVLLAIINEALEQLNLFQSERDEGHEPL
ncbi:PadR family transcriptional regulator [Aneurinibacillus tyrosinisolvens]|uniref:PadR family transcriptional regulator n=1 Tax=Aneurinibacillus tyrosinisolvens TaxID=1443435 RepID=UPI00063F680D|nr:PadR family transcriptional regulator [Aneurinibacillus tyrosinisolvens]